jgi:predicted transcriptional regulator
MAESEHDKLGQRYRALGREEPPPELDARIMDAARRAARSRPGRSWILPASIAAVVVLSVGVALQVQREHAEQAGQLGAPAEAGKAVTPAEPAKPAAPAAGNVMQAPALERKLQELPARPAARAGSLSPQQIEASPERWLRRIAQLRRDGRDDEADRELAEFRRRFPDYRIPQSLRDKVERR